MKNVLTYNKNIVIAVAVGAVAVGAVAKVARDGIVMFNTK